MDMLDTRQLAKSWGIDMRPWKHEVAGPSVLQVHGLGPG